MSEEDQRNVDLWSAVISQAILDATQPLSTSNRTTRNAQMRAREWLTTPSRDFDAVCNLAGIEPTLVRQHAAKPIAEATKRDMPWVPNPFGRPRRNQPIEHQANRIDQ